MSTNWSLTGTPTDTGGVGYTIGDIANVKDNDTGTTYIRSLLQTVVMDLVITFSVAHTITQIVVNRIIGGLAGEAGTEYLDYYDGSWHQVASANTYQITYSDWSASGIWPGVTKIRYRSSCTTSGSWSTIGVSELRGWGWDVEYVDSGIRIYNGAAVLTIGTLTDESTHKVRFNTGAGIVGIPLIATGGANDSGIRIFDGATVKTVPKI